MQTGSQRDFKVEKHYYFWSEIVVVQLSLRVGIYPVFFTVAVTCQILQVEFMFIPTRWIYVPSSAYCCVFGLGGVGPKSGK
jgi:hypothetical protein